MSHDFRRAVLAAFTMLPAMLGGCSPAGEEAASAPGGPATGAGGGEGIFVPPVGIEEPNGRADCGGDKYRAEQQPLDLYAMVDDSGSMIPWWLGFGKVFNDFLADPASAGIGVGIQYFGSNCDPAFYATPRVPIAPLPGNVAAIQASYPWPIEGTATEPAMRGAVQHARAWKQQNPGHKVGILLITDGIPSNCNSTIENVSAVTLEGSQGNPPVLTYVLGLSAPGFDLANLQQIAVAGGTGQAVLADPNDAAALANAMNQIRGAALPCDYALPANATDPTKVNIEFAPDGATSSTVPNVGDAAGCDAAGGWYYDNPTAPSRAVTCPTTCGQFRAATAGQVNVVVGCDIVLK